ncbi:carbohydrate ABC transporter permease [Atribacter laminatus]|uniref:Maltose/maltodextrin transport system permease protein MalG n=1 Tax=Atribacter laminatus TaxID=2847778 RepID=A0A7T1F2S9_ATRLM|nr:carbohydrate ABC transporter permease [Atribacter laminatus]QPM67645.1 Inner membrane ABC transporter permease protein YcjP [Atribacter laminatus]
MRISKLNGFLILIIATLVVIVLNFPIYWMFVQSVTGESMFTNNPSLLPKDPSLNSYIRIIEAKPIGQWFINTLLVAIGCLVLSMPIACAAAFSLSRFKTKLNSITELAILSTQMLSASLLAIPIYVLFRQTGLLNKLSGLIVANMAFTLPFSIWVLKGFFDGIPKELDEAAMIDGCNVFQTFYRIVLPLIIPGIVAMSIFSFILAWDEFFFARTLISSEGTWVMSIGLSSFKEEFTLQWTDLMAATVLFTIPPTVLFMFIQKHLVSGLTAGSIKG